MINQRTSQGKGDAGVFEFPKYSYIPYNELDPDIVSLVKALNAFRGITTVNSCGGHQDASPGQNKQGTWRVIFEVDHDEDGWFALEFIAWLVHDRIRGKSSIRLRADSPPPYLNRPGASLCFVLEGWDNEDPADFAEWMDAMREVDYIGPARRANYGVLTGLAGSARSLFKLGIAWLKPPGVLRRPGFKNPSTGFTQPATVQLKAGQGPQR